MFQDEWRPIQEHYRWRNYLYDAADFDGWADLTSGASFNVVDGIRVLSGNPKHQFSARSGHPPPLAFSATNAAWFYFRWFHTYDYDLVAAAEAGVIEDEEQYLVLSADGVRNCYGLALDSLRAGAVELVFPGAYLNQYDDHYFPNFAAPALETVDYYFNSQTPAFQYQAALPPLPGTPDFSVKNTTPLLIAPLGQPYTVAGWAKQAITNGYAGKFGYLEQYFDRAYRMSNGVATTNQTGLLSPYGEFFPTEPGPTALVTKPDLETGARGTAVVQVVKLQTDVDHNLQMDLSFAGPDNTSQARPMVWWLNTDRDDFGSGTNLDHDVWMPPGATTNDYSFGQIRTMRNLEDFARLWICGMPTLPTNQDYSVQIGWSQIDSGTPKLRLYRASETNGGIGYLTNITIASQQILDYNIPIGEVTPTSSLSLPTSWFTNGLPRYFLFEAGAAGKGALTLTIAQGTNTIAQTST